MRRFLKKLKRSRNPVPPENPAHQTTDPGAERDGESENTSNEGASPTQTASQDRRIEDQQLPTQNAPTLTPGHELESGSATLQERGHRYGGSAEARSEQLSRSRSAERDSNGRNRRGREDREPSETAPERTLGSGQDRGDAHDQVQSGGSRVRESGRSNRALGRTVAVVEFAMVPAQAFGPLKAGLATISAICGIYRNAVAVKDKIKILRSRIATLEELFERPANDERETALREGLLTKLKDIEERLRSLREKSALLQIVDNVQDGEDVGGILGDLQEAVNDYMLVQQMVIFDQGCKLIGAAESSVLNNFRCANGAEFRHGERKGCLRGTRGDVLNSIELWARDFDRSSVYWLNGLVGTGKSTIAKTIAERLFADGQLGASFFCSRDFEDRRNLQLIFPTLATQLARKYTEFRSILVPLIQSDPAIAYESLYNQMLKLIVNPLKQSGISTAIVIDALDECVDTGPASAVLSVLGRLVSEIPKVKFFLTGRPEPRISDGFRLPLLKEMTDVFVLHAVESDHVDSDIRLFFENSFSELTVRRQGLENWPTEDQLRQLCKRAGGLFIYAAAVVRFLDNNKWDPKTQLDLLLKSQKIGDPEGKPLDVLYTSILQEVFGDDGSEYQAKTRSVLGAVVLAANPLSPSAIATLLGFKTNDVLPLLSSVNSLLILQEDPNHPVRPFHKSFPDFITDPTRCTDKKFHISPPKHHLELLIHSLGLMNRMLEKNMCNLQDAVANSDVGDLKERSDKINPALRYACVSWHVHLAGTCAIPDHTSTVTPTLHQFLKEKFLFWLEVLSILGATRNAIEALQDATDWLETCRASMLEESPTLNLTNDCFRFVTGYFEVINASAPHIYHSALVSAPKESLVRKLYYESHAHPFARIVHGVPTSWDSNTAATTCHSTINLAVWSPCNGRIAIALGHARTMDILDSVTFQRLQTLESPLGISTENRALVFSPDSRILTCSSGGYRGGSDRELFVVSWDLQTGGVASVIKWQGPEQHVVGEPSITYSADGKMVGIFYWHPQRANAPSIFICDIASGAYMHSHSLNGDTPLSNKIWTHGEYLRFATADATTITVWQVGFVSGDKAMEVETLRVDPAMVPHIEHVKQIQLHTPPCQHPPTSSCQLLPTRSCQLRVALTFEDKVLVWDARKSECLLHCKDTAFRPRMSFSSDGRFFACSTSGPDIYLWKESPTGYVLHDVLAPRTTYPNPLLSPKGESIVAFSDRTIWLWRINSITTRTSSTSTRPPQLIENFILDFSPDGMLAMIAMRKHSKVVVLDLKSGIPQLTIDAGMEVYGLRTIGNTVAVIGDRKVATWNLPAEGCVPDTRLGLDNSSRTIDLGGSQCQGDVTSASVCPNSRHIAFTKVDTSGLRRLSIYNASTGDYLGYKFTGGELLWFAPDGRNVWCIADSSETEVWKVGGERSVLESRGRDVDVKNPPAGYPWGSSLGYRVTKDWWILGPGGKRLFMLPPPWQSHAVRRVWKGRFLALLHGGLSDPVILEVNYDL